MKKNIFKKSLLGIMLPAFFLAQISCAQKSVKTLKTAYKKDFVMGVAIGTEHILEKDAKANEIIKSEFNGITAENIMKAEVIHPQWDKYNFDLSDKFIELGQKNKMYITGHTLVWHSQLPPFIRRNNNKDSVQTFMRNHIATVAGRYAGKIDSWDVVNEALEEDGTLRKSVYLKTLGEGYIQEAFELAAKADPKAALYYNDYNIEQPAKRKGAIEIVKKLKAAGVKIDGVGIQGHWSINTLNLQEIEDAIVDFSKLGVKVAFTELDLTVLPNPWDMKGADVNQSYKNSPQMNPYSAGMPDSVGVVLAQKYEDLFKLFLKHKDSISRITFWGVNDGHSWLNGFPIRGRVNYPLLFDRNYEKKKAYFSVLNLKK
ncbi:MAG: endo-1,4-beta-xylanase [Spirosomataceae bacterium]|jgi:endo-1,4-beta-xylanase